MLLTFVTSNYNNNYIILFVILLMIKELRACFTVTDFILPTI